MSNKYRKSTDKEIKANLLAGAKKLVWESEMSDKKKYGLIAEIDYYACNISDDVSIRWLLDEDGTGEDFFVLHKASRIFYPVDCTTNIKSKVNKVRSENVENGLIYASRVHGISWSDFPCKFELISAKDLLANSLILLRCEELIDKVSNILSFGGHIQFDSLENMTLRIKSLNEVLDELYSIQHELSIDLHRSTCKRYINRAEKILTLISNPESILDSITNILIKDFNFSSDSENTQHLILDASDMDGLLKASQLLFDLKKISNVVSLSDEDEASMKGNLIESLLCLDLIGTVSFKLSRNHIDELQSWADLDYDIIYNLIDDYGLEIIRTAHPERVAFIVDADFDASEGKETGWRAKWFELYECMIVVNRDEIIHQSDWEHNKDIRESYNTYISEADAAYLQDFEEAAEFSEGARKWLEERSERLRKLGPYPKFLSGSHGGEGRVVGYSSIDTQMFPDGDEEKFTECFYIDFEGQLDVSGLVEI